MRAHLAYLCYVVRHKWFVFLAGVKLGVPLWQLIIHDWSKFSPAEWSAYVHTFYAPNGTNWYKPGRAFDYAWNHHQKVNPHHWQYWLLTMDTGTTHPLEMPKDYAREMVADWHGAGRALGKLDTVTWYLKNYDAITLHDATRISIDAILGVSAVKAKDL